jgi:hypothetical protein
MDVIKRASQTIAEHLLTWRTAHRDQAGFAKDLSEGKDISEVYGLGEADLFDEFFYFLSSTLSHCMLRNPRSPHPPPNLPLEGGGSG